MRRQISSVLMLMLVVECSAFVAERLHWSRSRSLFAAPGPSRFCEQCGSMTILRIPEGDERERSVCTDEDCGHVAYQNPKVVVGCVPTWGDQILLCKRAIAPCEGKWGFPQGFLELGETSREGAARETMEESGALVNPADATLVAVYNLPGQVQMVYAAPMKAGDFEAGIESSEVGLFGWDQIPWDELAFPTVGWALEYARDFVGVAIGDETNLPIGPVVPQQRTKTFVDGQWEVKDDFMGHD